MNTKQQNHKSNQANANKGSSGTSNEYQKTQDNRSKQLNPNNQRFKSKK
ncbi:alpha-amylase [Alteromonas genovensis]|uniref:Alpha-amylase n=1 Tax=Alteromonas genovensis TaxID=471225 RepID=A0A6N9TDT6_9ALTE|nr:alpha-amylase [Alteromonas genovensis]NDW15453.1 alpha-amylase [Alteromonas genovensis]